MSEELSMTPNWPYDLTPEQEKAWESAIARDINATSARITIHVRARLLELIEKAETN